MGTAKKSKSHGGYKPFIAVRLPIWLGKALIAESESTGIPITRIVKNAAVKELAAMGRNVIEPKGK